MEPRENSGQGEAGEEWAVGGIPKVAGARRRRKNCCVIFCIIIWPPPTSTMNYRTQEFDWLKSILTAV